MFKISTLWSKHYHSHYKIQLRGCQQSWIALLLDWSFCSAWYMEHVLPMSPAYKSRFTTKQQTHQLIRTHCRTCLRICMKEKYVIKCLKPRSIMHSFSNSSNCGNYWFSTLDVRSKTTILWQDSELLWLSSH